MGSESKHCDVCVVGAGLSGLRAASLLQKRGVDVVVLEAADRVGGRLLTERSDDGLFVDHGGQYVSPGQRRIEELAAELAVALFPSWGEGGQVLWRDGARRTVADPAGDPGAEVEAKSAAARLAAMAESVPLDAPWEAPQAPAWDARTIDSWLAEEVQSMVARTDLAIAISGVFARNAQPISLLAALFWARSGDPLVPYLRENAGPERRFVGGAQQLCLAMAEALAERVILGARVSAVDQADGAVRLSAGSVEVTAERVIIALPPPLAGRIAYSPALPALRDHLCQRVAMRWIAKVHCVYAERFWAAEALSGGVTSDEGTVRLAADNSPPSGVPGVLVGFIEEPEALRWSRGDAALRRAAVVADFQRYFGEPARAVVEYREANWSAEPFCRGVEAGYWPPGVWTNYGAALRAPCGRIHWAGTETSTVWNGKMEGALLAAEHAVDEVLLA